jgi:hypothetical protein
MRSLLQSFILFVICVSVCQLAKAERPNRIFQMMPKYPEKQDDLLNKWEIFSLQAAPSESGAFLAMAGIHFKRNLNTRVYGHYSPMFE